MLNDSDVQRLSSKGEELDALLASYRVFRLTYRDHPAAFVKDCFHWKKNEAPASYQLEILESLISKRRVSVRGPHGLGKTTLTAWAIIWFALTRDEDTDWKIPCTASAWRQLQKYLFPEVHKWLGKLNWGKVGRLPFVDRQELLDLSIKLSTGEAFALASNSASLIEGAHATTLLYIFDEAKVVPEDTWDSTEGSFATGDCYWLAVSTPGETQGRFYDIQSRKSGYDDWYVRRISLEETIKAGRVRAEWVENRRQQWGEDSAVFQNRVLGEFASASADGVIPLSWVEQANDRYQAWKDLNEPLPAFTAVGVDVGRGGNKSSLALRFSKVISELRRRGQADIMVTAGAVSSVLKKHHGRAVVDVIGIGAGVVDRLRELIRTQELPYDCAIVAFNAAAKSDRADSSGELGFANARAAAWWNMRELLDPVNKEDILLPPDDLLIGDLTAPRWRQVSGGKILIESKEEIYKRLKRSTDDGDAVVMAFFEDNETSWANVQMLGHIQDYKSPWK